MKLSDNPAYTAFREAILQGVGSARDKAWYRLVGQPSLEWLIALKLLAELYANSLRLDPDMGFEAKLLELLNITYRIHGMGLDQVRTGRPLLVVANHPFGIADGMSLLHMLKEVRPESLLLSTTALSPIPEMNQGSFILMAVHETNVAAARHTNSRALARILKTLKANQVIIAFPAGRVARVQTKGGQVEEYPWKPDLFKIALKTGADILPIYAVGGNGFWYHLPSHIYERLPEPWKRSGFGKALDRIPSVLLIREMFRMQNARLRFHIGDLHTADALATRFGGEQPDQAAEKMAEYFRGLTLKLSNDE